MRPSNDAILEQHKALIASIAGEISKTLPPGASVRHEDLVSAGAIGLMAAAEQYDSERAETWPAFAKLKIRCAMYDTLRDVDPLKRRQRRKAKLIAKTASRLHTELGRAPEASELSEATGLKLADMQASKPYEIVSLDDHLIGPDGEERDGIALDPAKNPEELAIESQTRDCVRASIEQLPERLKLLITLYYEHGLTMRQIGEKLQVHESRVSQLHKDALSRLKTSISLHQGEQELAVIAEAA